MGKQALIQEAAHSSRIYTGSDALESPPSSQQTQIASNSFLFADTVSVPNYQRNTVSWLQSLVIQSFSRLLKLPPFSPQMYPFPLVDPIHEPADISDTDFANLLALIDLQAQSPPPLQQQQPSFSVLASLGTTVPQSPAPSTVGPSQMFSDTALMALATPSPMSGTMGISPQLIYPDLLPPRHFTDPSPSGTVANSLSHVGMSGVSPIMTMASTTPVSSIETCSLLPSAVQLPDLGFSLNSPTQMSPPSQTPICPTPISMTPLSTNNAMLAALAALNDLNSVSVCGQGSNTNDCIDMSVLHNCSPMCHHRHQPSLSPPSPCAHGQAYTHSHSSVGYPVMATTRPRTLRRTAKLRNNQCPCNHPYTPKGRKAGRGQKMVIPARNSDGTPMICCNCGETETPSWRRHPLTNGMLCNACGLYFRLHKKPRPIAFDENGKKQVIRKNAAVKREPINLGHAKEMASNLAVPFQALKLMPANRSLSLRNDEDEEEDELSAADSVDSVG